MKYPAHTFAFRTRAEAERWRDRVRNQPLYREGAFTLSAPDGAVLTAHVVGPNRAGVDMEWPWAVATGARRSK